MGLDNYKAVNLCLYTIVGVMYNKKRISNQFIGFFLLFDQITEDVTISLLYTYVWNKWNVMTIVCQCTGGGGKGYIKVVVNETRTIKYIWTNLEVLAVPDYSSERPVHLCRPRGCAEIKVGVTVYIAYSVAGIPTNLSKELKIRLSVCNERWSGQGDWFNIYRCGKFILVS